MGFTNTRWTPAGARACPRPSASGCASWSGATFAFFVDPAVGVSPRRRFLLSVTPPGREAVAEVDAAAARSSVRDLFREPRFWQLLVPFFICGYTTTGLIDTHLIAHAVDHHIHVSVASGALATLAAFNVAGVLMAGELTDRVNRGRLLAGIYTTRAAVLLLLPLLTTPSLLFVFAALFGLADFATIPPTTALTRDVFRAGGWAAALGIISAAHQLGSALGAYAGGLLFDRTGGYAMAFTSAALALGVAAAASLRLARRTPTFATRGTGEAVR